MIIGTMVVEGVVFDAQSLKDKRSVLKSISMRVRQKYNVSIIESNHQDVWQRTEWTMVSAGTSKIQTEKELKRAFTIIENHPGLEVTKVTWEWY